MNPFDRHILLFFNEFAQKSWMFDKTISHLSRNNLLKGGVILAFLWALWFACEGEETADEVRKTIIMTILGAMGGLFVARLLTILLPFVARPINIPEFAFRLPFGSVSVPLEGWSSFPSDHAALFCSLSAGMFIVSKRIGLLVTVYTILLILLPRVYLGLHFPTDILGGAIIGILLVMVANRRGIKEPVAKKILSFCKAHPGPFYAIFFLISYQVADLFWGVRKIGKAAYHLTTAIVHHIGY